VRVKHPDSVPLDLLSYLADVCKRSAPVELISCPLCNWTQDKDSGVDRNALLNHIALELHSFSLLALPWTNEKGQDTDNDFCESANSVHE